MCARAPALVESNVIAQRPRARSTSSHHNDIIIAFIDEDVARFEQLVDDARALRITRGSEMHTRYWSARALAGSGSAGARREFGRALALARELKVRGIADECALAIADAPAGAPERVSQAAGDLARAARHAPSR